METMRNEDYKPHFTRHSAQVLHKMNHLQHEHKGGFGRFNPASTSTSTSTSSAPPPKTDTGRLSFSMSTSIQKSQSVPVLLPLTAETQEKVDRHLSLLRVHSPTSQDMKGNPEMKGFQAPKYGLAKGNWGYIGKDPATEIIQKKAFEDKLVGPAVTAKPPDFTLSTPGPPSYS